MYRSSFECLKIGEKYINIIECGQDREITRFLDIIFEFNFIPQITIPTRITLTSLSFIDYIHIRKSFTNNNFKIKDCFTGCLVTNFTSSEAVFHFKVFICIAFDVFCNIPNAKNVNLKRTTFYSLFLRT